MSMAANPALQSLASDGTRAINVGTLTSATPTSELIIEVNAGDIQFVQISGKNGYYKELAVRGEGKEVLRLIVWKKELTLAVWTKPGSKLVPATVKVLGPNTLGWDDNGKNKDGDNNDTVAKLRPITL